MLVATKTYERPARLWAAKPGEKLYSVPFDYCNAVQVSSMFRLSSGRIGLTVWCAEPGIGRLVALDLTTGHVELLTSSPYLLDGAWYEQQRTGFVEYGSGTCYGVGTVDGNGAIRPLELTVPLASATVQLANAFPPAGGGSECGGNAIARRPAVAPNERYAAFFLHMCDGKCTGGREFDDEWFVIVQDRISGRIIVSTHQFETPHGLAVFDNGALAVSARYSGITGIWYCRTIECAKPGRLVQGTFRSLSFRQDGTKLIAVEVGGKKPTLFDID